MSKFELFMGCLGNGVTVCNKAVSEHGDYKHIAHIAECGKITWYVNPSTYVPGDALLKIEHCVDAYRANFEKWINETPKEQVYEKLIDSVPVNVMLYAMNLDGGLSKKIEYLKNVVYEKSYF